MTPAYWAGRRQALHKIAGAATGALAGGVLGAALPTLTNSLWERPLRSLGGATMGALFASHRDEDGVDVLSHTAAHHLGGSVVGGVLGGFAGAVADATVRGAHQAGSLGTLGGVALGGTLGGILGGHVGARKATTPAKPLELSSETS